MEQGSRIEWADFVRAFAILLVVLCHSTEEIFKFNLNYISSISVHSKIFAFTAFTLGRVGVPLFLMLSGYFLLDRSYNAERTKFFWKNNWLHLLICTEIWFVIYEVFLVVYTNQALELNTILKDLLFIHKVNMSHVWYMPMILGMYVLFPFVSNILRQYELKDLTFPLLFFALFSFGYPFINVINNSLDDTALSLQISLGFSGGAYGIYFISGYISKKGGD